MVEIIERKKKIEKELEEVQTELDEMKKT